MESRTFVYKEWKLAYYKQGQSDTALLFVHGASSNKEIWKYLCEAFEDHYTVIALDLLGHGESEKPVTSYNTTLWADNIKALIDHQGVKKVILTGHSYGVMVIKQFYSLYPSLVQAMILVDGQLQQTLPEGIYNWMKTTLDRPDYEEYMKSLNQNKQAFCLKQADASLVNEAAWQTPKYVLKGQLESMKADASQEVNIAVPVLAFYAKSHEWTEETAQYLAQHTESLELHVWKDVAHFMMLEAPERMFAVMDQFIQSFHL